MVACAVVLVLTLGLRAALLPWSRVPQPSIHDEFSYLLAADTYAHGRFANPPHPFWQHFETFHVLQQPTYASKYQPLQGLVLAFGQKFFGQPWIGVYLSTGLMCAAICWMLQGWIAPDWALLGALLCAVRVGVLSYWMNSYFGGAVPGIGGALAIGAVARILRKGQLGHSTTWAFGLAIVVLSRPYDAAVLGCATGALLLWFLLKSRTPLRTIWMRVALPALIVLMACTAVVAYNDYRVTGHPLTLPVQTYDRQYAMSSIFVMIPLHAAPEYRHSVIRQYWTYWQVAVWKRAREHPLKIPLVNLFVFEAFFFPFWPLMIPILLFPYDLDSAEERLTVFLLLVFFLMIALLASVYPHYGAIFAGVLYLRFLHSLTRLWSWQPWGKPAGRVLAMLLIALLAGQLSLSGRDEFSRAFMQRSVSFGSGRRSVIQTLERQPGRHLVLVRYTPEHDPGKEWVYNNADIDASPIVWAREMTPEQDRPFFEYFRDRRVWLLEPDASPPKLSPYPREGHPR